MKRLFCTAILAASVVLAWAGCDSSANQPSKPPSAASPLPTKAAQTPGAEPEPTNSAPSAPAAVTEAEALEQQIQRLTVVEKVGQLVVIGLDGKKTNEFARDMIETHKVGGFILYRDNISDAEQTARLLNELKSLNQSSGNVPLWLSVDQEGGKVSRLPAELGKFPSAGQLARRNDDAYTRGVGEAIGYALRSIGFNMNYAPVLDINSNPLNPVIGDRAFGSDAETVVLHGLAMMDGLNSAGVAAVAKHFPGHGDTSVDSHFALPVVEKTAQQLKSFELVPFAEAIRRNIDAVMIAHLLMIDLDRERPASISPVVIDGLLREELGYDGVVVTDDMTMSGLTEGNNIGEAAVQAVLAGADLLLVGHNKKQQLHVVQSLQAAVQDGTLTEARLDESLRRLLKLKAKYAVDDAIIDSLDVETVKKTIQSALDADSR